MCVTNSVALISSGEAVVLGHVAQAATDLAAVVGDVEVEHRRAARGRCEEAEQDLDQRVCRRRWRRRDR
jgi:hypothetical protein